MAKKKDETVEEKTGDASSAESVVDKIQEAAEEVAEAVVETAEEVAEKAEELVESVKESVKDLTKGKTEESETTEKKGRKRNEKVGIVFSDKMTNTVVVRVNRMVKHQLYHKYMKKRKKFMAHDELGSSIGDRVRIVETKPLSAKKRWRVVEIIQKAEK